MNCQTNIRYHKSSLKIFVCLLAITILASSVFAQNLAKVGMTTKLFTDENRMNWEGTAKRPLLTAIWYPSDGKTAEEQVVIGAPDKPLFISGQAAKDAEISSAEKRYPLIVISHGTGGSALQMMWLGQYLAARGYIVAAVSHHGNTGAEEKPAAQGFILWWERATDIKVLIDKMLGDPKFGNRIDPNHIGAAGFSLGGTTVTSIAGGIFSIDAFNKFCASADHDATCDPQPEYPNAMKEFEILRTKDPVVMESVKRASNSYRDPRVKAVFAIAPALGSSFTPESLAAINIPFQIAVGESDNIAPAKTNAQKLAQNIKNSKLTILPGKTAHYTFLSECSAFGKSVIPPCNDAEGVDRHQIHQEVSEMAFQFFQKIS